MEHVLLVVGVASIAFAATNLDNLLILVGLVARPGQSFEAVLIGAMLASAGILLVCVAGALVADYATANHLGWLGLIPIALGVRELVQQFTARPDASGERAGAASIPALGVAALMLANSADSVAALLPLFAETRKGLQPVIGVSVIAVAVVGCAVARRLSASAAGPVLQRIAPRITPFVLIAVGLYVLIDTSTDTLR